MGYPTCTCPIRRHGCSSFMAICAALCNLLIHKLVRKHPVSSCAQRHLRCGSLLVMVHTVAPPTAGQQLTVSDGEAALAGQGKGMVLGGAPSGSVKPGFDGCCFLSKVSASCCEFSCFFYTSFKINLFFVSKVSLKFPSYCLILLMAVFLLNMIRFWQTHRFLCLIHTHTVYPHILINMGC